MTLTTYKYKFLGLKSLFSQQTDSKFEHYLFFL